MRQMFSKKQIEEMIKGEIPSFKKLVIESEDGDLSSLESESLVELISSEDLSEIVLPSSVEVILLNDEINTLNTTILGNSVSIGSVSLVAWGEEGFNCVIINFGLFAIVRLIDNQ